MSLKKGGLGKGYDALFFDNSIDEAGGSGVTMLRIHDIEPNKNQPRRSFDDDALLELSESIKEHGVLEPLIVRPLADGGYQLVAGERRLRASVMAGLSEVPVIIKTLSDSEVAVVALIENLQREDLNPIEEALGISRLIDEFGLTQAEAAQKIGKSRSAVANTLRLLTLPDDAKESLASGSLSAGHARTLLSLNDKSATSQVLNEITSKKLSVRETENLIKKLNRNPEPEKPKKRRDALYSEVEISLTESLGRKVSVKESSKGGKLEFSFYDKDDLIKLTNLLASKTENK